MSRSIPFWDPEQDDVLICREVRRETHDVATFLLTAPEPRLFAYSPGQFLTLTLPIGAEEVNRCYTISSSPTRPHALAITVKRVAGGMVSNWLHDTMRPGMEIRALGPMGDFTCDAHPAPKYLFLSGGSGITPMMAMSRAIDDRAADVDIAFLHSARSPDDLVFARELAVLEQRAGFRATTLCDRDAPGARWPGYLGRLSAERLALIVPDFREREVFVCGPAPYMESVREILRSSGFDMAHHHEESFDFATLAGEEPEVVEEMAELEAARFNVNFTKSRREISCGGDTTVLSAARAAGMRLPASCAKGLCGTCKCKLVSGTVEMKHEGGIRQRDIDQGMILICCSRPTSDLVVER